MKILVAEKDVPTLDLVRTRLEIRGYEVLDSKNSSETLHLLEREKIDLLLLSSSMERIGAEHLIDLIKKRPHLTTLPVILLTGEDEIAQLVMTRERGYDDFLTKPFNPFVLQLRVAINVEKVKQRNEANALTHLPGNNAIEKVIREKIEKQEKFSILYIDINNFKSFNDYYSFEKGDDVIRQAAKILVQTGETVCGEGGCFIGHIGGDDFIVITPAQEEESFARKFMEDFDQIIPTYYNESDRARGYIRVTNRRGKRESFPMMSCSVAACTNLYRPYKNLGEIARDAMEVKAFLKSQKGSHYLRDRRSEPLGGLEEALKVLGPEIVKKPPEELPPLGQILLQKKLVTEEDLQSALKEHLQTGQKLGEVITARKLVRNEEMGKILEKKLNVPYLSLSNLLPSKQMFKGLSKEFIKQHRLVPLEKSGKTLRVGMCDPLDPTALDAVRRVTGMDPVPALVMEEEFIEFMNRYFHERPVQENVN